jgi:hypothetical protein
MKLETYRLAEKYLEEIYALKDRITELSDLNKDWYDDQTIPKDLDTFFQQRKIHDKELKEIYFKKLDILEREFEKL